MSRMLWVILVLLCATASMILAADPKDDAKAMDGVWIAKSAELGGQPMAADTVKTIKLEMKAGKYTVTVGQAVDRGTVKYGSTKKPKTMDIAGDDGPNKGKTFLAIYELSGDSLKVCYDLSGTSRPTEFKTAGTKLFMATYQREPR